MSTDASGGGRPAAERLRELQRLHDDGLISDEEFEAQRARILDAAFGPGETPILAEAREERPPASARAVTEPLADGPEPAMGFEAPGGDSAVSRRSPLHPERWPNWLRIALIAASGVWLVTIPLMFWRAARYTWLPYVGVATAVVLVLSIAVGAEGDEADEPPPAATVQPVASATPAVPEPTPTRTLEPATTPSPVPTSTATPEPTPTGTPTIEEALIAFTFCERLRVDLGMKWGQAPGLAYSGDPRVSGDLEEGDYIRIHTRPNDAGEIRVKVYPHDGRTVGKTDDMVWISWSGLVHPARLDQVALVCED